MVLYAQRIDMSVPQRRLELWMYRFMLGTLSDKKTRSLREELERRHKERKIFSELERKLLSAFTVSRSTREYLAELFKTEEKRKFGN
ncbi:MAG: hypothetical protein A3C61_01070 [Candidatus Yanofskybacteria bacterium RIFCSPHIGHO2_02_FULL_39_10]|uniref:Uncharacterized protein n=1 Tax=Candidatus Yanofskybacteria bacterium RIFCSPHIGHO2_02_FULL_39_10 TaxID=1802674 RepID=A0A1F8F4L5_9BACT|nr:MAG: hypothetical protein A3C61_01070 [Candidatus Yanofskybacteria bacterium RIFCSPHIGHO2_02_FULL_39_10]